MAALVSQHVWPSASSHRIQLGVPVRSPVSSTSLVSAREFTRAAVLGALFQRDRARCVFAPFLGMHVTRVGDQNITQ